MLEIDSRTMLYLQWLCMRVEDADSELQTAFNLCFRQELLSTSHRIFFRPSDVVLILIHHFVRQIGDEFSWSPSSNLEILQSVGGVAASVACPHLSWT